jgi:hypothetical protein
MKGLMRTLALIPVVLLASSAFGAPIKEVSIWVARDVAPGSKVRLTINTRNVPVVHMAAYRL